MFDLYIEIGAILSVILFLPMILYGIYGYIKRGICKAYGKDGEFEWLFSEYDVMEYIFLCMFNVFFYPIILPVLIFKTIQGIIMFYKKVDCPGASYPYLRAVYRIISLFQTKKKKEKKVKKEKEKKVKKEKMVMEFKMGNETVEFLLTDLCVNPKEWEVVDSNAIKHSGSGVTLFIEYGLFVSYVKIRDGNVTGYAPRNKTKELKESILDFIQNKTCCKINNNGLVFCK